MKLLPDYLIKYMPAIEDAIEEIRLSVIDHTYELIQSLDIDELSSDNIKDKLELYDIKTDNMSNEWLPNGKFYRLFASIQHHRTRLNTIKAISKSGGQFEGLWTDDFKYKSSYNYKSIQILRHYYLGSSLDGYFYISGNVDRNPDGTIRSSARTALLSDIIMSHALPAGYTYLYLPWPRPSYPLESGYFYNVHMLDYDRLVYEKDRDHRWLSLSYLGEEYNSVYYCPENHEVNQYYNEDTQKYGSTKDSCEDDFDRDVYGDREFYTLDSYDIPASVNYDWLYGSNTPWRCPYWFDYHYMNDMRHVYKKKWPIPESGKYTAFDKYNEEYEVDYPGDAVKYTLEDNCKELADSKSVLPSNCASHIRYAITPPNRKSDEAGIKCAYDEYSLLINKMPNDIDRFISDSVALTGYSVNIISDKISDVRDGNVIALKSYISDIEANNMLLKLSTDLFIDDYNHSARAETIKLLSSLFNIDASTAEAYLSDDSYANTPLPIANSSLSISAIEEILHSNAIVTRINEDRLHDEYFSIVKMDDPISNYSADELYHSNDSFDYPLDRISDVNYFSTYRHDALLKRALHTRQYLSNFKQYRPFWNEKAPFVEMNQRTRSADLDPELGKIQQNSIYNMFYLKQSENRPQLSGDIDAKNASYIENIVKDNNPPVSEVTFTSYDRPTRSSLDRIYIGYLTSDTNVASGITDQGANYEISQDYKENKIYHFDESSPIEYDPTLYYNLISLGYRDENGVEQYSDDQVLDFDSPDYISSYLYGDPSTGELFLNKASDYSYRHSEYNYLTYKTSKVHKLWFSNTHKNMNLSNSGELYNQVGNSNIYDFTINGINLEYIIIGIFDENDRQVQYSSGSVSCSVKNHRYSLLASEFTDSNNDPVEAAYVLFRVKVIPGLMDETNGTSVNTDMRVHYSGAIPAMIRGKVVEIAREED